MMRTTLLVLGFVAGVAVACNESPTNGMPADAELATLLRSSSEHDVAQGFALALAKAMAEEGFQVLVRDVLQGSSLVEHKIELARFLETEAGGRLMETMARRAGLGVSDVGSLAARLPALDFYVPVVEQRLAWLPGQPLAVGYAPSEDDEVVSAYSPSGAKVQFSARNAAKTPYTLFLLHPAEPKSRRFAYTIRPTDGHIQATYESGIGGVLTVRAPNGELVEMEIADFPVVSPPIRILKSPLPPIAGVDAQLSRALSDTQVLSDVTPGSLLNWDQPFDADGVGACEIYSRQEIFNSGGTRLEKTRWPSSGSIGGLPCDHYGTYVWDWMTDNEYGIEVLSHGFQNSNYYIRRRVLEDDAFFDDDWGVGQYEVGNGWPSTCYYDAPFTPPPGDGYCVGAGTGHWQGTIFTYHWSP